MIFSDYLAYEYLYNSPSPAIGDVADIAAHKHTIQDAIASGIDGFQFDYYNDNGTGPLQFNIISNMLEAAKELHSANPSQAPFLLFLSPALAGGGVNQTYSSTGRNWVEYFVASFASHTNYFHYNGKPVLGSFMGLDQQTDLTNLVFTPLANEGIHVFYVPSVNNASQVTTDGTHFTAWGQANIGALHIWPGNIPANDITGTNAIVAVNAANSVPNVVGVSVAPYMDTHSGGSAPYFEHFGGEGPDSEYQNAIPTNPAFIIESPWNDLSESYSSPIDVTLPTVVSGYPYDNLLKPHRGYSEIRKYYAQWLKTGIKPTISQDFVAYFYRTSPYAANNNPSNPAPWNVEGTTPIDNVYVTCDLVSSATLQINTGGTITTYNLGAGRNLVHTPFTTGTTQNFQIIRKGVQVATVSGEPIIAAPTQNNLQSTSGFSYGPIGVTMPFPTATVTQGSGLTINTLPNAGQQPMANSLGVTIASDQSVIPVTSLASGAITNPSSTLTRSALLTTGNVTVSTTVSPYFTWTTAPSSPLVNGQGVYLGGTTVPGAFTANVTYYVRDVAGNTFNLSATLGGPAIVPTSTGTAVTATMQYKPLDLIASSALAGSVAVPFFSIPNTAGGAIFSRIRLIASLVSFSWQGANLSINLWSAAPTYTNGDAQAYAVATGGATWLANFLVGPMTQFGDAAVGAGQLTGANEVAMKLASGTSVYWDLQIASGFVGTSPSQTFTLIPELLN